MATIKCIECGEEYSATESRCPHCGHLRSSLAREGTYFPREPLLEVCKGEEPARPVRRRTGESSSKQWPIVVAVIAVLVLVGAIFGAFRFCRKSGDSVLLYQVRISSNLTGAGAFTTFPNGLEAGSEVTLYARPDVAQYYYFSGWYDGDTLISDADPYTFTMPEREVSYIARYYQLRFDSVDDDSYRLLDCVGYPRTVVIPEGVAEIGSYAFRECTGLSSVVLPEGLHSLGQGAFLGCTSLSEVSIPASIGVISSQAFADCSALGAIYYRGDLATWCTTSELNYLMTVGVADRSLYINDEKVEADILIPETVPRIEKYAFYGCTLLTAVDIPANVTSIGGSAFCGCTSLYSVHIGAGVKTIGISAFKGCTSLSTITYDGTVAEWGAITKGADWNNGLGGGHYVVECNDGNA